MAIFDKYFTNKNFNMGLTFSFPDITQTCLADAFGMRFTENNYELNI